MNQITFILLFSCTLAFQASAQLIEEHVYLGKHIHALRLADGSIKYWQQGSDVSEAVVLYNEDHSFWKYLSVAEGTNNNFRITNVSQRLFNEDDYLEVAFSIYDDPQDMTKYISKIYFEGDNAPPLYLEGGNYYLWEFILDSGFDPRMFHNGRIYNLFNMESVIYQPYTLRYLVNIEGEGEFVVYSDTTGNSNSILLFNQDDSLWKTFELTSASNTSVFHNIFYASKYILNGDSLVELSYIESCFPNYRCFRIVNEQGLLLFETDLPDGIVFWRYDIYAFPGKLCFINRNSLMFYDLETFQIEKNITNIIAPRLVNIIDKGWVYYYTDPTDYKLKFWNADHTLWKELATPVTEQDQGATTIVNSDKPQNFEDMIFITTYNDSCLECESKTWIWNEAIWDSNGNNNDHIILEQADYSIYEQDIISFLENPQKLITRGATKYNFLSSVYCIEDDLHQCRDSDPVMESENLVFPNPFQDYLSIFLLKIDVNKLTANDKWFLYSESGQLVKQGVLCAYLFTIDELGYLPSGFYLLKVLTSEAEVAVKLIKTP